MFATVGVEQRGAQALPAAELHTLRKSGQAVPE
jgi:hypothetical protein